MSNPIYSAGYIETHRSSGYRSSIYAMAELIDNSIDAGADKIEILLNEKEFASGQAKRKRLSDIVIADNGSGMTEPFINSCLTFAKGSGVSANRIGKFGVGLLQSSIFVGQRVEVFSKEKKSSIWRKVYLDIEESSNKNEATYDDATEESPPTYILEKVSSDINTIIYWSKLDRIDAAKADTLIRRAELLFGRIYRYKIKGGLSIKLKSFDDFKGKPINDKKIIPYDPLFLTNGESYEAEILWDVATNQENLGINTKLGHKDKYRSSTYYKKFIKDCEPFKTSKPIFQKDIHAYDITHKIELNGQFYSFVIRASFAYRDITKPGVRNGGSLKIGQIAAKKMSGSKDFKSANIFFMRNEREIDFGVYDFYRKQDEVSRWWTIEIHFDSNLDDIMGLSNNKQSVVFHNTPSSYKDEININETLNLAQKREYVWSLISEKINDSISRMQDQLKKYATEFKDQEERDCDDSNDKIIIKTPERSVIDLIKKSKTKWSDSTKDGLFKDLKPYFYDVSAKELKEQIEMWSKELYSVLVIYAPNETGKIFDVKNVLGYDVIYINKNHPYYIQVIEPLKSHNQTKDYAIAIEIFVSTLALQYRSLKADNDDTYKIILDEFLDSIASKLRSFLKQISLSFEDENVE